MAVDHPSDMPRVRGLKLREITDEFDASWHRGSIGRVDHRARVVVTEQGAELAYDHLVLALGARSRREWHADGVLTYHDAADAHAYRRLLRELGEGRATSVGFVRPAGATWLLPLYELALATAAECTWRGLTVELNLVTPEAQPLEAFGTSASADVHAALQALGVRLHTSSVGVPSRPGRLHLSPGDRLLRLDRIVTLPRLTGPALRGVPCNPDGFIRADAYGRVIGVANVFAAGDATTFPIKQGGLAAQQADAVAGSIAASAGADVTPRPFRPVLRGLLTGDGIARYMRASIAADAGDACTLSEHALWWPPNRLCGRFLAPFLSSRLGSGAAMHQDHLGTQGPARSAPATTGRPPTFAQLADLTPRAKEAVAP
jgi:sulfide:quinone oxidoreductase